MTKERVFQFDLKESFVHLEAAPIVEAVIHWAARATKPWHPDEIRKQLADRLSDYPDCRPQHELQLEAQFGADGTSSQTGRASWRGFRLTSSDKLNIAQFNRDGLVFSRLKPYENWETFTTEGRRLWEVFLDLARPSEVQRLGVRFVNRIAPITLDEVGRYLTQPPKCLEPLGLPLSGFLYQSMHDVPGHPFQVRVVQTVQPPAPTEMTGYGLILDIDVFTAQAFRVSDRILRDNLNKMHWLKNKAFFSLLKKSAIKSFEKAKP